MIDTLLSRASAKTFEGPGPDDSELRSILEVAVRAPDHGSLRPWRFFVIRGSARMQLSDLFVSALKRREPDATDAQVEKERGKPLRSPVTIAVAAKVQANHKIPVVEQTLAAAAAAMNILNAAHALGFGAKWVTGANCYDEQFRSDFGLAPDELLLGFIHIGSGMAGPAARPDPASFTTEWPRTSSPDR